MCGIFGFAASKDVDTSKLLSLYSDLFLLSESRGKEAAGFVINDSKKITFGKTPFPAHSLINSKSFIDHIDKIKASEKGSVLAAIGHSRLVTNGYEHEQCNNQPVIRFGSAVVHNGIIINHEQLWQKFPEIKRESNLDSEIIPVIISQKMSQGLSLEEAVQYLYSNLNGMTSIAALFKAHPLLVLATNNGSLYRVSSKTNNLHIFASERHILNLLLEKHSELNLDLADICQVEPQSIEVISLLDLTASKYSFLDELPHKNSALYDQELGIEEVPIKVKGNIVVNRSMEHELKSVPADITKFFEDRKSKIKNLKRCSRCLLPETFPFIAYDKEGICNYCHNYKKIDLKGKEEFTRVMYHARDNRPQGANHDCLMPFSGGRDSSFALHYVKKELGLKTLAFSYDWGMLTDLARRNQSRMCGALGVEHILISADIRKKRDNIRRNVSAWLKRPSLGTIPLFMAGDKQYFYYANLLLKQNKIDLSIMGENLLETTRFKTGFCGIKPRFNIDKTYTLSLSDKLKMLAFYGKEYLLNPSYINRSLVDTLDAFKSYYLISHNNINIFNFLPWNEQEMMKILIDQYDWETDPETPATWRIGDGTAAFYNYIYFVVAGFTENDTFRSNQIREGMLGREEAINLVSRENEARWGSIQWYTSAIGIDWLQAVKRINGIRPLV